MKSLGGKIFRVVKEKREEKIGSTDEGKSVTSQEAEFEIRGGQRPEFPQLWMTSRYLGERTAKRVMRATR